MKKIILIALALFSINSCVNDTDDYRKDRDKPYEVPSEYLFSQAEKYLSDRLVTPNFNRNVFRFLGQYWTETTYYNEVRYDLETRKVPQNFWNGIYINVLGNIVDAKRLIEAEQAPITSTAAEIESFNKNKLNRLSIIELLEVYSYQILVDTYGNVPYSQAGKPFEYPSPKYDDAATIYSDLITRAESAVNNLDASGTSFGTADFYYNGNVSQWIKFGNSLLIKLGISIADVNPSLSQKTVNKGFSEGAIVTNTDNTLFKYSSTSPNFSPLYESLVAGGRKDFVAADTFVNMMNSLNDPRRTAYFQLYDEKDEDGNIIASYYKGGKFGLGGNTVNNSSKVGTFAYTATTSGVLFEASEVNLYLAEAAARGGYSVIGPETYYNQAITQSFEFWGVPIGSYLSNADVAYSSASGTWKEKIGKQAWIALYNRIESWNTKRRLDYPVLNVSSESVLSDVPIRFRYPIDERSVNATNYAQAANAIGGDFYYTKIFWDID